ncbi:MAG: AMP-binding protein, partial [Bacteroidota bacterium]|nr:AMP-binding protein [Bacteroidota bacterium]
VISNYNNTFLQVVIFGGEALNFSKLKQWKQQYDACQLINMYGITETTVHVTYQEIGWEQIISSQNTIGKPIPTLSTLILDTSGHLVPVGITGELHVGGEGLARGYLNRPDLTAQKFIKNPFDSSKGSKLYKTGDLGRYLPNGTIEYIGRIDDQVKIRGFRIELGEIENVLSQSQLVKQVVVVATGETENNKQLVCYIVPNGKYNKDAILNFLKNKVPSYMVPSIWIVLDKLPLNKNGKVDRNSLPNVESNMLVAKEHVEPNTIIQKDLCNIWQNVLQIGRVGIFDNFFELGGSSLSAMRVVGQVKRLGYKIEFMDLFANQTIKDLSEVLEARSGEEDEKGVANTDENYRILKDKGYKFLIPIKVGSGKLPLYIVSGGGGTAYKFKKMADFLEEKQSVYGIQQPTNQKDLREFPVTVENIAAVYIAEILHQNPDGPYAISGHCAGGIIAYEMVKQLESMGKKVVFLAMFDTIAPVNPEVNLREGKSLSNLPSILKRSLLKAYLKVDFETFLFRKHTRQALEYKINSLKYLMKKPVPLDSEEEDIYQFYKRLEDGFRIAQKKYRAIPYNGNILIYYAKYHYRFLDISKNVRYRKFYLNDSIKNSWNQYAKSTEIYEVEGEHSSMFDPEVGGKELARLLQEHLNRSNVSV